MGDTLDMDFTQFDQSFDPDKFNSSGGGGNFDDDKFFFMREPGVYHVRFLPSPDDAGNFRMEVSDHRNLIETDKLRCPNYTFGMECPICNVLSDSSIPKDTKYKVSTKFYSNAIIRGKEDPPKVHIMQYGWTVYKWYRDALQNPAFGNMFHPLTGIDIIITRTGYKLKTEYKVSTNPEGRTPLMGERGSPDIEAIKAILDQRHVLSDVFKKPDDKTMDLLRREAKLIEKEYKASTSQVAGVDLPAKSNTSGPPSESRPDPFSERPHCFTQFVHGQVKCGSCPVRDDCMFQVEQILLDIPGGQTDIASLKVRFSNAEFPLDDDYITKMLISPTFNMTSVKIENDKVTITPKDAKPSESKLSDQPQSVKEPAQDLSLSTSEEDIPW